MYYLNNPTKPKPTIKKKPYEFFIPHSWANGVSLTWSKCGPLLEQQGCTLEQAKNGLLICKFIPDEEYPFIPIPNYEFETTSESLGLHT